MRCDWLVKSLSVNASSLDLEKAFQGNEGGCQERRRGSENYEECCKKWRMMGEMEGSRRDEECWEKQRMLGERRRTGRIREYWARTAVSWPARAKDPSDQLAAFKRKLFLSSLLAVLWIKLRTSDLLVKRSTTEPWPQSGCLAAKITAELGECGLSLLPSD